MSKRSELVLPPGTYAYSLDRANAQLSVLVGPVQNKLEELEGAVMFDAAKGRMVGCPIDRAIKPVIVVPVGSYAVITNPYCIEGHATQPPARKKTQVNEVELQYGRTEHVPGPAAIVPWPGQDVTVQEGYRLNADQYIVVEIVGELGVGGAELCAALGISTHGRQVIRGDVLADKVGSGPFIPPTGMQVLGGTKAVKGAVRLGSLDWARVVSQDGDVRYLQGERLVFPEPHETIEETGEAYDLRACGLHLRRLGEASGDSLQDCAERFITSFGEQDQSKAFYWPNADEEILTVLEPIEIPRGGGVYVRAAGSNEISVYGKPGPVLFNPLEFELVARGDSAFAPAAVVQENEALEINSPTGTRYLLGPETGLLDYDEQIGKRVKIMEDVMAPLDGICADTIAVKTVYNFRLSLTGEVPAWFADPSPKVNVVKALDIAFTVLTSQMPSTAVTPEVVMKHLAGIELVGCSVSAAIVGPVTLVDKTAQSLVEETKRADTIHRLTVQSQQQETAKRQAEEQFTTTVQALERKIADLQLQHTSAKDQYDAERERMALTFKKEQQELLDEISTYELDREARRAQQGIELKAKEDELERAMITARAAAQTEILAAIQPELIAAIKAAGAQTSFAKVVQHLGPASILQGVGLQDALKRIVGDDAASSMLLTGTPVVDKPNGSSKSKRSSAES